MSKSVNKNGNKNKNKAIGVFDSGVGGLTVVREIMRQLPDEKIIYFGDTARLPYGSKSKETIVGFARQIKHFLETKEVKAIVIACNTASAYALDTLDAESDIPVMGVIHAGAKTAVEVSRNGKIGVIGTLGTISSGVYPRTMQSMREDIKVIQKACPLFVPMAEEGLSDAKITEEVAHMYLDPMKEEGIDTLVMGCTHYPLLRPTIEKVMGEGVTLVNPAYETAKELAKVLKDNDLTADVTPIHDLSVTPKQSVTPISDLSVTPKNEYYASDLAYKIKEFAESILPDESINVIKINIDEY